MTDYLEVLASIFVATYVQSMQIKKNFFSEVISMLCIGILQFTCIFARYHFLYFIHKRKIYHEKHILDINNGINLVTCASKLKVVRGIPGEPI